MSRPTDADAALWDRLVEANTAFARLSGEFLGGDVDRVAVLREVLRNPGPGRMAAFRLLNSVRPSERQELFGELMLLASFAHGAIQVVRDAILSLPRDWVLEHIEEQAESLLRDGTYDEYRRMLELYYALDRDLTRRLARRAAARADEDIREAGEDFLEKLGAEGPEDGGATAAPSLPVGASPRRADGRPDPRRP